VLVNLPWGQYGAVFSSCRRYRLRLWRRWADGPHALFVLMNCSKADEIENDPTVERCYRRAMAWARMGFMNVGAVEVVNAFAWVETDSRLLPSRIKEGIDIIGPGNDQAILDACKDAAIVVCGWGNPGNLLGRGAAVLTLLRNAGVRPYALAVNADGTPKHPLYIGYDVMPLAIPRLGG
jgi:hypothetical protein